MTKTEAIEHLRDGRELTAEERMAWGVCPVCGAQQGEFCSAEIGLQLGHTVSGRPLETGEGVHLARLKLAPMRVKVVAA